MTVRETRLVAALISHREAIGKLVEVVGLLREGGSASAESALTISLAMQEAILAIAEADALITQTDFGQERPAQH